MTWEDRIAHYERAFPKWPKSLFLTGEECVGLWRMGNDYRVQSGYYGGYPATYLKRVRALFPEKERVLHLFSGMVDLSIIPGETVDLNADLNPTYVDDGQTLYGVPLAKYDMVMVDPPYSVEDAERYQTSMVKRIIVMRSLLRLRPGTHLVWLDQVMPQYEKLHWRIEAQIGMVRSTNHRFRVVTVFRRR